MLNILGILTRKIFIVMYDYVKYIETSVRDI